jgi:hypothetical protein
MPREGEDQTNTFGNQGTPSTLLAAKDCKKRNNK